MRRRRDLRIHANQRANQRYGIRLTGHIREQLLAAVEEMPGRRSRQGSRFRFVYETEIEIHRADLTGQGLAGKALASSGKKVIAVRFVWDKRLNEVVTLLPLGRGHEDFDE